MCLVPHSTNLKASGLIESSQGTLLECQKARMLNGEQKKFSACSAALENCRTESGQYLNRKGINPQAFGTTIAYFMV
jgi:hypothetical protein